MRCLLLPQLAAFALPTAVNAESVCLIIRYGGYDSQDAIAASLEKIEMRDKAQCEENGAKWMSAKNTKLEKKYAKFFIFGYECLTGK